MKYSSAAVLALGGIAARSDAFVLQTLIPSASAGTISRVTSAPLSRMEMVGGMADNDDFLDALRAGKKGGDDDDTNYDQEEVSQGSESSRFRELMKAAKLAGGAERQQHFPRAIDNPFLNPPPAVATTPQQQPLPYVASGNPADLSVEEQARMFREMMAQQQQPAGGAGGQQQLGAVLPPPPPRVAKTDRAGRPVGRNRDADSIANTADLYFAQLKRDSTVRTMARLRGDDDVAGQVFADEGIKQLDDLLQKNPYLQGQKDDEMRLIESLPNDLLAPYFESSMVREEDAAKSGISYKQKLMERRQKGDEGPSRGAATSFAPGAEPAFQQQLVVDTTSPRQPEPVAPPPVVSGTASTPAIPLSPAVTTASSPLANPEETRQKIRTLMGLILKHRGGPGFGKGRLKGPDVDRCDDLMKEIASLLREEAKLAQPIDSRVTGTASIADLEPTPVGPPGVPQTPPHVVATTHHVGSIDSTIACIEGAILMYKNSPPQLQQSVLVTLRSALVAAVDSCNAALAAHPPPPVVPGSPDGRVDGVIACIEGAVAMYKNSPPQLRETVLATLRVALMSAVETCNHVVSGAAPVEQQAVAAAAVAVTPLPEIVAPPAPTTVATTPVVPAAPSVVGTDPNSKAMETIYENVKAARGDGSLGLRSDLTAAEATKLADQLVDIRKMLMAELEAGIPDPEPVEASTGGSGESSASKYQAMLARARAEKAAA